MTRVSKRVKSTEKATNKKRWTEEKQRQKERAKVLQLLERKILKYFNLFIIAEILFFLT